MSFHAVLAALGLAVVVVEDAVLMARIAHRHVHRNESQVRADEAMLTRNALAGEPQPSAAIPMGAVSWPPPAAGAVAGEAQGDGPHRSTSAGRWRAASCRHALVLSLPDARPPASRGTGPGGLCVECRNDCVNGAAATTAQNAPATGRPFQCARNLRSAPQHGAL